MDVSQDYKDVITEVSEEKNQSFNINDYPIDPGLKDDDGNELPRPYNKNQMRKWVKKIKWENRKSEKRAREKVKAKQRRIEAKVLNIDIGPSRKALKRRKLECTESKVGVIIDLSFDNLMKEKDRFKVIKQILRCYSINRRSTSPLQFHITSFGERTKSEISRHNGYENWDVKFEEKPYIEVYAHDDLVYLTSESENLIETFEPNIYYIIGGLVDHNEHKGLCHKTACAQGIKHARLPLDKYIDMKTRKVLTIDHVFEIVLRVVEGMSWPEALMKVLPMRKGAVVTDASVLTEAESKSSNEITKTTKEDEPIQLSGIL